MTKTEDKVKNLIKGWENETPEERAKDIDDFLNHVLTIKSDTIKEEAKQRCITLQDLTEFKLLEEKTELKKKVEKYDINKKFKGKLKKIKRKIHKDMNKT